MSLATIADISNFSGMWYGTHWPDLAPELRQISSLRSHIVFLREAVFRSNPLRSHLYVVAENGRRLITSGDVAAHGRKTCHKQRNSAILSTGQLASTFALMVFDHADSLSQLRLAVVAVVFIGATVWFELQRSADLQDGSAFSR
eukprot:6192821-Pleurochrysis_carterae.AAC.5